MTANNIQPQPIPETVDIRRFELTSIYDIAHTLRQFADKRDLVAIYFHAGQQFTLTAILAVDRHAGTFIIDQSGSPETNRRLLASGRNIFVATPDGIKHQFVTGPVQETNYQGRPALLVRLPTSLIKLQRREYFRMSGPVSNPLGCRIFDHPAGRLEFPVKNLGLGGLCLTVLPSRPDLQVLDRFHDCSIDLYEFGRVNFGLEIRYALSEKHRSGKVATLLGCQFTDFSNAKQTQVQRYITVLQKDIIKRAG